MSLNKAMLIGNVGRDPEVRYLEGNNGAKVATFTLATTERYRDRNGETRENTEWHNIVAWRNTADVVERFVRKGTQLYIEGRIRTRSWDDQTGNKRYTTEIIADTLQLLGKKSDNPGGQGGYQPQGQQGYQQPAQGGYQQAQPYQQPAQSAYQQPAYPQPAAQPQQPAATQNLVDDMPEDDLPF
ncbi:MAG: single-stranded DNA-binding protein [Bacteroidales bacterium]|nr:single-stranded DNA-binding protein [Bacteroidales bacterium]